MMEAGENQPQISRKRIKSEESIDEEGEDRISPLQDSLLHEIISRLPSTKEAARTGIFSKRWEHVWKSVSTLIFEHNAYNYPRSEFILSVKKALSQCRQLTLKKFVLYVSYDHEIKSQIRNWIRYAISRNVEELQLRLPSAGSSFQLDKHLLTASCFTHLTFEGCEMNPQRAIRWNNLRSLCISSTTLYEADVKNILSGTPQLETLVLRYCSGYGRLDITSNSIKKLVLCGYYYPRIIFEDDIIEINAPNIQSLTIQRDMVLWKILLLDVSSLVEANLDYERLGYADEARQLKEEEMLQGLVLNLRHVNELNIGILCSKVKSRLEAKGFIFPPNMKFPAVIDEWGEGEGEGEEE